MSEQCSSCGGDCWNSCKRENVSAGSITFTREEIKKHEKCVEDLRNQVYDLKRVIAHLESRKMPIPGSDCKSAFEQRHGFEVGEDMDIQTEVAWGDWQEAWNAALEFKECPISGRPSA